MKNVVRIGIVGLGKRAMEYGHAAFADCTDTAAVTAVCDVDAAKRESAIAEYERLFGTAPQAFEDYEQLLDRGDVEGVYVAVPNDLHMDVTLAALKRDIHVLCEKPMAVSLEQADGMIDAAERSRGLLAFGMQMHYRRRYHEVRRLIDEGAVGKPAMVWCAEHRHPFPETMGWVFTHARSGGALVEKTAITTICSTSG